jgi:hypothetical protein
MTGDCAIAQDDKDGGFCVHTQPIAHLRTCVVRGPVDGRFLV